MSQRQTFKYVQEFNGSLIPLNQKMLQEEWVKNYPRIPFTGACAGMVCEFISRILKARELPQVVPTLSKSASVRFQENYERNRDPDEFLDIFVLDRLFASAVESESSSEPEFCQNREELFRKISTDPAKSQILVVKLILDIRAGKLITQEHLICIIKRKNIYLFCDPNNGIAVFTDYISFQQWLVKETQAQDGALVYLSRPIPKSIVRYSHRDDKNGEVIHGQMQVRTMRTNNYVFGNLKLSPLPIVKILDPSRLSPQSAQSGLTPLRQKLSPMPSPKMFPAKKQSPQPIAKMQSPKKSTERTPLSKLPRAKM